MNQLLSRLVVNGTKYSNHLTTNSIIRTASFSKKNGIINSNNNKYSVNTVGTKSIVEGYKRFFCTLNSREQQLQDKDLEDVLNRYNGELDESAIKELENRKKNRKDLNVWDKKLIEDVMGTKEKEPSYYDLLMREKTIKDRMSFTQLQKDMLKYGIDDPVSLTSNELISIKETNEKLYNKIIEIRKFFPSEENGQDEIYNKEDDDLEDGKFDINLREVFNRTREHDYGYLEDDISIDYVNDTPDVIQEKIREQKKRLDRLTYEDLKRKFNSISDNDSIHLKKIKEMFSSNVGNFDLSVFSTQELKYFETKFPYEFSWLMSYVKHDRNTFEEVQKKLTEHNNNELPFHDAAKRAEKLLKKYLNKFFIKVHPDLFYNNLEQRTQNQTALTQLNNLLRMLEDYIKRSEDSTDQNRLEKIPSQLTLTFHASAQDEGPILLVTHNFVFNEPPKEILSSRMELITYTTELRFSVYRQIFELFKKSGIDIPKEDFEGISKPDINQEIYDDPWEDYFRIENKVKTPIDMMKETLDEYGLPEEFEEFSNEHRAFIDSFDDNRVFFYLSEGIKGDMDVLRVNGFRDIAEEQLVHLKTNLMAIEYKEWSTLPILIAGKDYLEKLRSSMSPYGFVVLQSDFNPKETLNYIKTQVPDIKRKFESLGKISTNNRRILEDATINLELLLNGGTVVVENLFSINHRSLEKVKELFNNSMTQLGDLKLPSLQFLDQSKAQMWKQLPKTQFDQNEFGQWKMYNLSTSKEEQQLLIDQIEKRNQENNRVLPIPEEIEQRTNQIKSNIQNNLVKLKSDIRETPLELIDNNKFNSIQSTPYLNSTMDSIERLTKLFKSSVKVPFYNKLKPIEHVNAPTTSTTTTTTKAGVTTSNIKTSTPNLATSDPNNKTQQNGEEEGEDFNPVYQHEDLEIFKKYNVAEINVDMNANVSPNYVSSFDFLSNNNNNNNNTNVDNNNNLNNIDNTVNESQVRSSIEDILSGKSSSFKPTANIDFNKSEILKDIITPQQEQSQQPQQQSQQSQQPIEQKQQQQQQQLEQIEHVDQTLSDFNWKGINLIISDRYQFIVSDDYKNGFCFIPSNFVEQELFLYLNSIQDSFDRIQEVNKGDYFDLADTVHSHLVLEKLVNQIINEYGIQSIKIDNIKVDYLDSALSYLKYFKSALSSNNKLRNVLPYLDIIISKGGLKVKAIPSIDELTPLVTEKETLISTIKQKLQELSDNLSSTNVDESVILSQRYQIQQLQLKVDKINSYLSKEGTGVVYLDFSQRYTADLFNEIKKYLATQSNKFANLLEYSEEDLTELRSVHTKTCEDMAKTIEKEEHNLNAHLNPHNENDSDGFDSIIQEYGFEETFKKLQNQSN